MFFPIRVAVFAEDFRLNKKNPRMVFRGFFGVYSIVCYLHLRFDNASLLFEIIIATLSQVSRSEQDPHVSFSFLRAHCRMGQSLSQKGVLTPFTRQPLQFIISGVISTPLSLLHSSATCRLKLSSLFFVAILA